MTNQLVGDHQVEGVLEGSNMSGTHLNGFLVKNQVAVVDVDEGVLEGSDMSGTNLNGFLVKNQA